MKKFLAFVFLLALTGIGYQYLKQPRDVAMEALPATAAVGGPPSVEVEQARGRILKDVAAPTAAALKRILDGYQPALKQAADKVSEAVAKLEHAIELCPGQYSGTDVAAELRKAEELLTGPEGAATHLKNDLAAIEAAGSCVTGLAAAGADFACAESLAQPLLRRPDRVSELRVLQKSLPSKVWQNQKVVMDSAPPDSSGNIPKAVQKCQDAIAQANNPVAAVLGDAATPLEAAWAPASSDQMDKCTSGRPGEEKFCPVWWVPAEARRALTANVESAKGAVAAPEAKNALQEAGYKFIQLDKNDFNSADACLDDLAEGMRQTLAAVKALKKN